MSRELRDLPSTDMPGSFGQVVLVHRDRIYRVALAMTGSTADAEDVTQEVFLSAYAARGKFRGESTVGTWLYRIAVNASLDALEARRRGPLRPLAEEETGGEGDNTGAAAGPEERADASLLSDSISQALNRLSPRERAVFVLRHFEDLPLKEVAEMLSVRTGTVKSLLFRAVAKLQKELSCYKEG